jgi:FkbM family methyltransferase
MADKRLVYSCVFFNENYLALTNLLLESFARHDTKNTKYLIIASPRFKPQIQKMFDDYGIDGDIWTLPIYTQFGSACARLHIFSYPEIDDYSKILYLDVDMLITAPLEPLFNKELDEKLYAMQLVGATVTDWGNAGFLFRENDIEIASDRSTFTSCILMFKNCERIKALFLDIKKHIEERVPGDYKLKGAFDQDFIIYQCFIQDCYDNTYLNTVARSNGFAHEEGMILNHFSAVFETTCATPDNKLDRMKAYLARLGIKGYTRNIIHVGANVGKCYLEPSDSIRYILFNEVSIYDNCIFVEPIPNLFKQLQENYNTEYPENNFIFINKAVSNAIGETEMTVASEANDFDDLPEWATMLGSIDPQHILKHDIDLIMEKITVPTTTLNEIVNDTSMTSIDLLLVDTEGHDFHILNAYNFSILPKRIIFEHFHMPAGDLSALMFKLRLMGYERTGQTELDMDMRLSN